MDALASSAGSEASSPLLRRTLFGILLGVLAVLCLWVLRPFLSSILWAAILAYVTWPPYSRLCIPLRNSRTTAASIMTLLVSSVLVLPLLWLVVLVQHELLDACRDFATYISQGQRPLPSTIRDLPWLGDWLQQSFDHYSSDPAALGREFPGWLQRWGGQLASLLGDLGRNLGKLLVTMLTLFFFYRDGDALVGQSRRIARRFFGDPVDRFARAAGLMTRAVVYGLMITALAQGLVAGVGYRIVGLDAPVLLGVLTGLLSTAPLLGTAFIWVPLAVGLIVVGHTWKGLLLLAWGVLLVHPADNVLRPVLISNVTRVPFLLVMFGALGGLAAFGLVGVFVGPVLLGIATTVWKELEIAS